MADNVKEVKVDDKKGKKKVVKKKMPSSSVEEEKEIVPKKNEELVEEEKGEAPPQAAADALGKEKEEVQKKEPSKAGGKEPKKAQKKNNENEKMECVAGKGEEVVEAKAEVADVEMKGEEQIAKGKKVEEKETKKADAKEADVDSKDVDFGEKGEEGKEGEGVKAEEKKEENKEEEEVVEEEEEEEELPPDERPRITKRAQWNNDDSTINILADGNSLGFINGWRMVRAAIRADTGIKMGTYAYEVKIIEMTKLWEFWAGFSTLSNPLIEDTMKECAFQSFMPGPGPGRHGGDLKKGDVIAVKLARTAEETSVTVYVNGVLRPFKKDEKKQIIPNMSDAPLFPHIIFRGCGLATNFREKMFFPITKPKLRMIDDCASDDVELSTLKFPTTKADEPTIIVPMTLPEEQEEWIRTFANENKNYVNISPDTMMDWADKSGVKEDAMSRTVLTNTGVADLGRFRNYVVGGLTLSSESRTSICKEFPQWKKICKVKFGKGSTAFGGIASLPTEAEGFDEIQYITTKEENEEALKEWNDRSKKLEKLENLPKGPWFKERWTKWAGAKLEAMKNEEYKDFSKEDWLLAELQCRIHSVIHAFKEDVNDPERPSFALTNLIHYCKLYAKPVNPAFYGVEKVEDFEDLIPGSWVIDDGMVLSAHEKDVDFDVFFKLCKDEREGRAMRLEAGDEAAKLTFASYHSMVDKKKVQQGGEGGQHTHMSHAKKHHHLTSASVPGMQRSGHGGPHHGSLPKFTPLQARNQVGGRNPKPVRVGGRPQGSQFQQGMPTHHSSTTTGITLPQRTSILNTNQQQQQRSSYYHQQRTSVLPRSQNQGARGGAGGGHAHAQAPIQPRVVGRHVGGSGGMQHHHTHTTYGSSSSLHFTGLQQTGNSIGIKRPQQGGAGYAQFTGAKRRREG